MYPLLYQTKKYPKELESLNKKINIKHLESLKKIPKGTGIIKQKLTKKLTQKKKKNTHYTKGHRFGWEAKGRRMGGR